MSTPTFEAGANPSCTVRWPGMECCGLNIKCAPKRSCVWTPGLQLLALLKVWKTSGRRALLEEVCHRRVLMFNSTALCLLTADSDQLPHAPAALSFVIQWAGFIVNL